MKPIRIAHISDLHLRSSLPGTSSVSRRLSRSMPALLEEAVREIGAAAPDLVAVTGDLVDHPLYDRSGAAFAAEGERDLRLVRRTFDGLRCPVVFLHGNHDHPGLFRRVFPDQASDFDVGGWRVLVFNDDEVDCHQPQRMGGERGRFLAALGDGDPRPQVHLQHYLVAPERNEGYPHTYREAESLKAAIASGGRVRLVLSGHYHAGERMFREGGDAFRRGARVRGAAARLAAVRAGSRRHRRDGALAAAAGEAGRTAQGGLSRPRRHDQPPAELPDRPRAVPPDRRRGRGAARPSGRGVRARRREQPDGRRPRMGDRGGGGCDQRPHGCASSPRGRRARRRLLPLLIPATRSCRSIAPTRRRPSPAPRCCVAAAGDLDLDLSASFMLGDRASDLLAGRNAGCLACVLVRTGVGRDEEKSLRRGRRGPRGRRPGCRGPLDPRAAIETPSTFVHLGRGRGRRLSPCGQGVMACRSRRHAPEVDEGRPAPRSG